MVIPTFYHIPKEEEEIDLDIPSEPEDFPSPLE